MLIGGKVTQIGQLVSLFVLIGIVVSCSNPVGVKKVDSEDAFKQVTTNALLDGEASRVAMRMLARYGLKETYESDPKRALRQLHDLAVEQPHENLLGALAELSYLVARDDDSKEHFLAAVVYSYLYLFPRSSWAESSPYDPFFRLVCDLYNRSLSEFLRSENGEAAIVGGNYNLPFGNMEVVVDRGGFPWPEDEFHRFVPTGDFLVRGLEGRNRIPGLGASLVAIRSAQRKQRAPGDFLALDAKFPATAFMRLQDISGIEESGDIKASLELYATLNHREIECDGRVIPLEADFSTPIAFGLEESLLWSMGIRGFLSGSDSPVEPGLYMLQPYESGKIPVVFVHGTASSPARWAEMFNELFAYEDLRDKFQFWFFLYTTGNPIIYSASLLREELKLVKEVFDPHHWDAAFQNMVVIGHSQGGLLTKMQGIDSEDRFWRNVTDKDISDVDFEPQTEELLRRVMFFERLPFVNRLIYLATPHGGSFVAEGLIGKISSALVSLPSDVVGLGTELFTETEAEMIDDLDVDIPTSVDNMNSDNPFLKTLRGIPLHPDVTAHSIIAVDGDPLLSEADDGVVKYTSAHIDGVASEKVVRSGHSCQSNPHTILEVHRILLQHYEEKAAELR